MTIPTHSGTLNELCHPQNLSSFIPKLAIVIITHLKALARDPACRDSVTAGRLGQRGVCRLVQTDLSCLVSSTHHLAWAGETGAASHGAECPTWESVSTGEPTKVVGNMYTLDQRILGAQDRSEEDFPWLGPVRGDWGPGIIEAQ